jgi:hypothetical protein
MSNKASNMKLSNVTNYLKSSNKFVIALAGLFTVLVVGMIVYWVYQAVTKARDGDSMNPILVAGPIDPTDKKNAKHWKLPISSSTNSPSLAFTMSFWMYISNWNYRYTEPKAILIKGNWKNGGVEDAAPGIWLARKTNRLVVATRTNEVGNLEFCDVDNIPLQKWVHVSYVLDNRVVDIYVNGKLERSCVLTGVPLLNNRDLFLFPLNPQEPGSVQKEDHGFMGQFSSLRYFSTALRPVDVARLYNEGPHSTKGSNAKKEVGHHGGTGGSGGQDCPPHRDAQYTISIPESLQNELKNL